MIGWDLLYISRAPSTSCLWAQEKPVYELKVKRVQAHLMSTNLDLPTSQLLVSTRKGSKPDPEFNVILLAQIP